MSSYYLISEHRHEIYVTMASPSAAYLAFLGGDAETDTFLDISMYGPLDINNYIIYSFLYNILKTIEF